MIFRILPFLLVLLPCLISPSGGSTPLANYWIQTWTGKWVILLAVALVMISLRVWRAFHWSAALAFLSTTWGALYLVGWHQTHFHSWTVTDKIAILGNAAYAMVAALIFTEIFCAIDPQGLKSLRAGLGFLCGVNSVFIIVEHFADWNVGGFLGNPSMTACLLAVTYPIFLGKDLHFDRWSLAVTLWKLVVPVWAIFLTGSSMGIGVLAVVFAVRFFMVKGLRVLSAVIAFLVILGTGWLAVGSEFLSSSGRFDFWRIYFTWWVRQHRLLFGMGPGTGELLFPWIPTTPEMLGWLHNHPGVGIPTQDFYWAHNDWLGVLFEQGLLGLFAFGLFFYFTARRARTDTVLFPAVIAYGVACAGNYMVHMPLQALTGATLIAMIWRGECSQSQNAQ